jgi:hypothetical protein
MNVSELFLPTFMIFYHDLVLMQAVEVSPF